MAYTCIHINLTILSIFSVARGLCLLLPLSPHCICNHPINSPIRGHPPHSNSSTSQILRPHLSSAHSLSVCPLPFPHGGGGGGGKERMALAAVISETKHVSSTFSLSWEIRETGKKKDLWIWHETGIDVLYKRAISHCIINWWRGKWREKCSCK